MSLLLAEPTTQPHSGWDTLVGIGIVLLLIGGLWVLNRLIMHFFPSTRNPHTSIGNALMQVEATFLPGREHIMEAIEREEAEADEQGDSPHTGSDSPHAGTH